MSLIIASTNEGCANPVTIAVCTAADFNGRMFDGTAFDNTSDVTQEMIDKLISDNKLILDSAGCYDYARWKLVYGDNDDQTMILGPGDGIVFTQDGKYFGMTERAINMFVCIMNV